MVFDESLIDYKSLQVSETLLRALADLGTFYDLLSFVWSWFFIWFSVLPLSFPSNCSKWANYYWYHYNLHILQLLQLSLFLLLLFYSLWVLHTSFIWWSFREVWVAASLLRSPGLFSAFYPILTMLWSVCSWFFFWYPVPPIFLPSNSGLFQVHQLQLFYYSQLHIPQHLKLLSKILIFV